MFDPYRLPLAYMLFKPLFIYQFYFYIIWRILTQEKLYFIKDINL